MALGRRVLDRRVRARLLVADMSDPDIHRATLDAVPVGGIVRADGDWGVVCIPPGPKFKGRVIVDFWVGGRSYLPSDAKVEVLTRKRKVKK